MPLFKIAKKKSLNFSFFFWLDFDYSRIQSSVKMIFSLKKYNGVDYQTVLSKKKVLKNSMKDNGTQNNIHGFIY